MRTKTTVILFIFFAVMLSAPAANARLFWSNNTANDLLWRIFEEIETKGSTDKTTAKLERFLDSYPSATVADEAAARLAKLYMQKKDFEGAEKHYKKILKDYPGSSHRMDALFGLAYCQYRNGFIVESKSNLESIISNPETQLSYKVKADRLLKTIDSIINSLGEGRAMPAVGAILPLGGRYSKYGEQALKGIVLAVDDFTRDTDIDVELLIKDSTDKESRIKDTVSQLARNQHVSGIVGPLMSRNATAVARAAQRGGVPALVLSQKPGIPEIGDYVFRNFLTLKQQAEAIASYAIENEGLETFAILSPKTQYGRELARHFKAAVTELGATVLAELEYEPGKKDFGEELRTLFEIESEEGLSGRRHVVKYTRKIEAEALYIPDNYTAIAQIAPHLAFYSIKDIRLFGSSGWKSPKLLELASEYIEGAVFVNGFFAKSQRPGTASFVKRFYISFGYEPGIIEAEAYDSTMLLLRAMEENDEEEAIIDRNAVRESIINTAEIEGATGSLSFTEEGEAVKDLFLLTIEKNKIKEIVVETTRARRDHDVEYNPYDIDLME
ncbi:Branched-chain amino acid ABC transporter, amino acid-binding protein (TC 3.A.1.4.1) [hydrothermal vent metagenome]|uniref:Branched-chain amino acid ABC transporter, amino acid-binding protein (TC 3.A.1.4.1) n=1 Tax=hydrothermal vent metagenome TaxID=652676 RepID=A0A3B0RIX8_9ZZZZ